MSQRLKILTIDRTLLVQLFRQDYDRQWIFDGMPADAEIVGVSDQIHFLSDQIAFKIRSEAFEEVVEGQRVPELKVTVRAVGPLSVQYVEVPPS